MSNSLKSRLEAKRDKRARHHAKNWAKPPPPKEAQDALEHAHQCGANEFIPMIVELAIGLEGSGHRDAAHTGCAGCEALSKFDAWLGGEND